MTIAEITSLFAIIGSLFAIYIAYRKAPHEEGSMDADTAKTYEETAAMAGERALRLEKEIAELRARSKEQGILIDTLVGKENDLQNRVSSLEYENSSLVERVRILEAENGDLREWASRLLTQVKNLGGTPVSLREKRGQA